MDAWTLFWIIPPEKTATQIILLQLKIFLPFYVCFWDLKEHLYTEMTN